MAIDPENIINIGDQMLSRNSEMFTTDFETNKEVVETLTDVESRRVRNRIAGYVTRRKKADS